MFSFSFLLFCSTWNILFESGFRKFFICEIFNEWKFFIARPPPYYNICRWLKKMTWKRFHFLWIFSHWKRLLKIFKCEKTHKWKFSSVEPLAHTTGNEKFFKCKQLHECHAHVSVFFSFFLSFVKKITLKALTIVKYFTQFLSISKLFRNVSVYSLVFVRYCEGFHKVSRKILLT